MRNVRYCAQQAFQYSDIVSVTKRLPSEKYIAHRIGAVRQVHIIMRFAFPPIFVISTLLHLSRQLASVVVRDGFSAIWIQLRSPINCVTLGKLLNFFEALFPLFAKGGNNSTYPQGFVRIK